MLHLSVLWVKTLRFMSLKGDNMDVQDMFVEKQERIKEMFKTKQKSIIKSVALNNAVNLVSNHNSDIPVFEKANIVVKIAKIFEVYLRGENEKGE